jgi:DNA-3-methyladenine glycosylase II
MEKKNVLNLKAAISHLSKIDPVLGTLIRSWEGECELGADDACSPYESLFRSVVYQQLSGKAAGTILGRVKALYPKNAIPKPKDLLGTPDEKLRSAGLSGAKTAALKDLAAKRLEGLVPTHAGILKLSDAEIVERLCAIRGIGPWTVEMMLMFKLGRPDVLPATDYGVRKGFALTYRYAELPPPKEIMAYGERWRPYRSVAAWYMWRAIDLARAEEARANPVEKGVKKRT